MKKLVLGILCLSLTLGVFVGCTKKEDAKDPSANTESTTPADPNEIVIDELGLTYKIPTAWDALKTTNLYPLTVKGDDTFAEIIYGYISTENLEKLNSDPTLSVDTVMGQICEILIAKTETFTNGTQDALIASFETSEKIGEQGEYTYYFLTNAKTSSTILAGTDLDNYNKLLAATPDLRASISTRAFDDTLLQTTKQTMQTTITFETTSIEGGPVDSTMFADYDLTMINFGGTYTYPDYNEFATLEEVYQIASKFDKKVNLIEAIIDAPGEESTKAALTAKKEASANFLTIVMDTTLGTWVKDNLEALPSTVFVNKDGKIVGEIIKGTKTSDEYLTEIYSRLETLETEAK